MYANVRGNVALKTPLKLMTTAKMYMFDVKASKHTGNVVPVTVTKRQYLRPMRSDKRPNAGQLRNARTPLIVSITPTAK
jgi:hypothetical protein